MKIVNRLGLGIILFSATLTVMAGAVIAPVLNLIKEGVGADPSSVGLIITIHALFIVIFSPFVGMLIDRIGTKKVFIFGLILFGLAGGAGMFITSFWLLLVSRAILGIAVAAVFNPITVMILNLYEGMERNKVMGWRSSANSAGGILWPLIGGFVGALSWHLPFAIYLIGIPLGIVAMFVVPETQAIKRIDESKTSLFKIFRNKPILFAFFGLLFWNFILLYTIVVFLPQKLETIGIIDPSKIGVFISVLAIAAGTVSLLYAKIKAKLSYKSIVLLAIIFWAIGFLAISQAFSVFIIILSVILFGIGQGMILPAIMILIGETVNPLFRGRIMSYTGTFIFLGQFVSPLIWGAILLTVGLNGIFLTAGIVCIILFVLFGGLMKKSFVK